MYVGRVKKDTGLRDKSMATLLNPKKMLSLTEQSMHRVICTRHIRVRIGTCAHERVHIFVPEKKGPPSTSFTHGRSTGQPQQHL